MLFTSSLPLLAQPSICFQREYDGNPLFRVKVLTSRITASLSSDVLIVHRNDYIKLPLFICKPTVVIFTENTTEATHRLFQDFLQYRSTEKVIFLGPITRSFYNVICENKDKISCCVILEKNNLDELQGPYNLYNFHDFQGDKWPLRERIPIIYDSGQYTSLWKRCHPFNGFDGEGKDAVSLRRLLARYT